MSGSEARRPVVLGLISGIGLALLLVAALSWNGWHHRSPGNEYPNPYAWGGVGLCLVGTGMAAYAMQRRRHRS